MDHARKSEREGAMEREGVSKGTGADGGAGAGAGKGTRKDTSAASTSTGSSERTKRSRGLMVVGIVVLVVAVVALVAALIHTFGPEDVYEGSALEGQAPYKTQDEIQAELDRVVSEGMFNISIVSSIEFEDAQAPGKAYIENVPANRYDMQVTITDDESGAVLYESGVLKPNQYIEDIYLASALAPGTHAATALFTALDPDTLEEVGETAAQIALVVKE